MVLKVIYRHKKQIDSWPGIFLKNENSITQKEPEIYLSIFHFIMSWNLLKRNVFVLTTEMLWQAINIKSLINVKQFFTSCLRLIVFSQGVKYYYDIGYAQNLYDLSSLL